MNVARRAATAAATVLVAAAFACGDDEVGVRGQTAGDSLRAAALADEAVLKELRSTDSGGRLVYDPPPDLSLASAQSRRPDIFKAPAAPAKAATPAAPR
jgi:hypothetical protein